MIVRRLVAALLLAGAAPALAYLLPTEGILRRMGERRAALQLDALEVTGTLQVDGPAADRLAAAGLPRGAGGQVSAPARFLMKVPGRCRLELVLPDVPEAARPRVSLRDGKVSGAGGLDAVPAAAAWFRAVCTLLATHVAGDASTSYGEALTRRGVALSEQSLGRFDGRIAYVLGGRERDAKPLAFVDKDGFQPLRLVASEAGARVDVRLLGWGSPTGGDWFPRAVEAWEGDQPRVRFTTERASANPKLADALF